MIRRTQEHAELGLDSLTDTMTNMMGLILLMVAIVSVVSGGMQFALLSHWTDPGNRTPIYFVCTPSRILFMHRDGNWQDDLARACQDLESQLSRPPTTGEALLEANQRGLTDPSDLKPIFVREIARENGQEVYVVGLRFLPHKDAADSHVAESVRQQNLEAALTPAAKEALAAADPKQHFIDAFVYEDAFDTLLTLQQLAKDCQLELGWRPMLAHQNPGLSELGTSGTIGGGQ